MRLSREAALAERPREHPSHGRPQRHRREDGHQGGVGRAQAPWAEHGTGWAPRTGKEEDSEVGLQYFRKRYLNPLLGRWISADPLAVHAPGQADLNLYAYVSGAVLKNIDPLGLEGEEAAGIETKGKSTKEPNWIGTLALKVADFTGKAVKPACAHAAGACAGIAKGATGSSYWQQRLLDHYLDGMGETMELSEAESRSWVKHQQQNTDGAYNPWISDDLQGRTEAAKGHMKASGHKSAEFAWKGKTEAGFDGQGGYTAEWDIRVKVTEDEHGNIQESYSGTLHMTDKWNFDPKEPGKRQFMAELKTRMGQAIFGTSFLIDSGKLKVHGTSDTTVVVDKKLPDKLTK